MKHWFLLLVGIVVAAALLGVYLQHFPKSSRLHTGLTVSQSAVSQLPNRSPVIPATYLAQGLVPPTNKWYSTLAFSAVPQPVFAYPISFKLQNDGYSISNPPVVSSANAIFGSHIDDVFMSLGSTSHKVQSYDDLSVLVANQGNDGSTVAETRITHGSPYVFTTFKQDHKVIITARGGAFTLVSPGKYRIQTGGRNYGVYSDANSKLAGQLLTIDVKQGNLISVFALPGGDDTAYFTAAKHAITGTYVTYTTSAKQVTTTYHIQTESGATLFAATPSMKLGSKPLASSFSTLLGRQAVYSGTEFTDVQPTPSIASQVIDLSHVSETQRADLVARLTTDVNNLNFKETDSYFGGKELYRAANLLVIAETLKQAHLADELKSKLSSRLGEWLDPAGSTKRDSRYFYYDNSYKGAVGSLASYGSESFNDHHFHFGYFIYAAATLSRYDATFAKAHAGVVNILISDIASNSSSKKFPKLRVFDPYVGHSWASGNGDFGDGNNQESSSEASNAWYAIYLWSQVTNNQPLASEAIWLYAHETLAARAQLSPPAITAQGPSYEHKTVGIVWGGKLDYSTFFSPRPQAVFGIQLIPFSPGQSYLTHTNIKDNLTAVAPMPSDLDGQFSDYLIMYQSLIDPATALVNASNLKLADFDNANSSTYLYAWLYSHANNSR